MHVIVGYTAMVISFWICNVMPDDSLDTNEMLESSDDFAEAYTLHATHVYQFLYWRTRDTTLSEDLTSSVFEKAWRSRQSFQGGSVQAWLYRIARNSLTDHWRKKKDIPSDDIDALADPYIDQTAEEMDQSLANAKLQQALNKLPEQMHMILELRFIENMPAKQVAIQLNITESNVRVLQLRALRKLRIYLK